MESSQKDKNSLRRHQKTKKSNSSPIVLNAAGGDLKGEIRLIWEPIKNAGSYLLQKSTSAHKPLKWKYEDIISTSSYTVSNLRSKKSYWFRVTAITTDGLNPRSLPVRKKAP